MTPVIIFGPTGSVGSATALTAHTQGCKVYLALRDTTKPIPGLTTAQEQSGNFTRIQTDFSNPTSITTAVAQSKAKHAFIYTDLTSPDHMRGTFTALKEAGVEFVVLLSSFGVQGDIHHVASEDVIAYVHAQAEISLREVFEDDGYVAVRPGFYASNSLWWRNSIQNGNGVRVAWAEGVFDWISPGDVGCVSGMILARRARGVETGVEEGKSFVYLVGPEQMSVREVIETVGSVLGREVSVIEVGEEEGVESLVRESGLHEGIARSVVGFCRGAVVEGRSFIESPVYGGAVGNIERFLGREAMGFREWVEVNRGKFGV
ncbi:NAD(P)-binding protein [Aspergillus sclerotioniger CBS 115572]|uniref:NAD(P)-binding protein n=1 Tax=Aspergillus sclerotioniger CBS 115572 TaxID=1450535 RepID=A0A317V9F9_9EURO|nr:NAD(P)-binding protein [Aspergillus sclerotioniger CBS 115572]PWY70806.1 NAD(P)-binding protein [Aspergillus sclerotioniger CBS 115572]